MLRWSVHPLRICRPASSFIICTKTNSGVRANGWKKIIGRKCLWHPASVRQDIVLMNNGCAVHLLSPSRAVWPDCSAGWRRSSPSGVDSETPGRSTSSRLTPSNIYHSHLWLHLWVTARLNNISGLYPHCHTLKQPLVVSFHHSRLELHIYQNKLAPCTPSVAPVALVSTTLHWANTDLWCNHHHLWTESSQWLIFQARGCPSRISFPLNYISGPFHQAKLSLASLHQATFFTHQHQQLLLWSWLAS